MQPSLFKRIKRTLRYLLLRAVMAAVGALPLSWALALGDAVGRLAFRAARSERAKALRSLQIAFPSLLPAERQALALKSFAFMGRCLAEICSYRRIDRRLRSYVELTESDRQLFARAVQEGRGVIFVSGHVGNFELLARRLAAEGFPNQTIAQRASDPRSTAFLERLRASGGVRTLWRGTEGMGQIMNRTLADGQILGFVIDVDTRVRGFFVDFFGVKAFTPRAAADLALRHRAAVLAGFVHPRPQGGHRITLTRVPLPASDDPEAGALALTQALTSEIEAAIRQSPHCWSWTHQRWKTRPPEENPGVLERSSSTGA
jgi:KDO2-lipid IV(A) lauroyltransferase